MKICPIGVVDELLWEGRFLLMTRCLTLLKGLALLKVYFRPEGPKDVLKTKGDEVAATCCRMAYERHLHLKTTHNQEPHKLLQVPKDA